MTAGRAYPDRPIVGVGAVVLCAEARIVLVRRGHEPLAGEWSLPGGVVEIGETLHEALVREIREETRLTIEPLGLAGFRETIIRDPDNRIERHFVILPFAARWIAGEACPNEELSEARWVEPAAVAGLPTTPGLAAIVAAAFEQLRERQG